MILITLIVVRMIKITTVKFVIIIFIIIAIVAVVSIFRSLVGGVLTWFIPVLHKLTSLVGPEKRRKNVNLRISELM